MSDGTLRRNVFITGGSGCVGQYLLDVLLADPRYHVFLLLRNPDKLPATVRQHPRLTLVEGTLASRERWLPYLQESDYLINMAASWGGPDVFEVNVEQSLALMNSVNRERCKRILYFSTSSILDSDNRPLEYAKRFGTDYIRAKYLCHERLNQLDVYDRIITLFPAIIMAAGKDKPASHVSSGIPTVARWVGLIRFLKADGSFHFIHAHDIALVTHHLLEHNPPSREMVLANPAISLNECAEQFCSFFGKRMAARFELTVALSEWIIKVFKIQMSPWDYYYLKQRHFRYKDVVNPSTFGLSTPFNTLAGILAE